MATEKQNPQWKDVEFELPEVDDFVVCYNAKTRYVDEMYSIAYYDGEDWYTADGLHIRPTHWMEIPPVVINSDD